MYMYMYIQLYIVDESGIGGDSQHNDSAPQDNDSTQPHFDIDQSLTPPLRSPPFPLRACEWGSMCYLMGHPDIKWAIPSRPCVCGLSKVFNGPVQIEGSMTVLFNGMTRNEMGRPNYTCSEEKTYVRGHVDFDHLIQHDYQLRRLHDKTKRDDTPFTPCLTNRETRRYTERGGGRG